MYKITNKTPHPFDIHTKQGPKVIHAFGELTADFEPAYLELVRLSFGVEEIQAEEREQAEEEALGSGEEPNEEPAEAEVVPKDAERYQAITGKKPDGRWSEERLAAELEKLSK